MPPKRKLKRITWNVVISYEMKGPGGLVCPCMMFWWEYADQKLDGWDRGFKANEWNAGHIKNKWGRKWRKDFSDAQKNDCPGEGKIEFNDYTADIYVKAVAPPGQDFGGYYWSKVDAGVRGPQKIGDEGRVKPGVPGGEKWGGKKGWKDIALLTARERNDKRFKNKWKPECYK